MGNKHSKGEITQSELLELQKKTYCMLLRFHPYPFHSSVWRGSQVLVWKVQEDQLLQRRWWTHWLWVFRTFLFCSHPTTREFRTALGIRGGYFYEQFYELFDKSKDGLINFDEFASAIAMMSNKMPQKDKLKCTWFESLSFLDLFHFYDTNNDGSISRDELKKITQALLSQNYISLTDEQIDSIINETFRVSDMYFLLKDFIL